MRACVRCSTSTRSEAFAVYRRTKRSSCRGSVWRDSTCRFSSRKHIDSRTRRSRYAPQLKSDSPKLVNSDLLHYSNQLSIFDNCRSLYAANFWGFNIPADSAEGCLCSTSSSCFSPSYSPSSPPSSPFLLPFGFRLLLSTSKSSKYLYSAVAAAVSLVTIGLV